MKKRFLLALGLTVSLLGCGNDGLSFQLSENQLESQIKGYFPFRKEALLGRFKVDISQPDLILKSGSKRAALALKTNVFAGGVSWPGDVMISFGVDYEAKTGTFYLIKPKIESFKVVGIPAAVSASVTSYLMPLVQQQLKRVPVYTLKADSTGKDMARRTLKKIEIKDQKLNVILGWVDTK